MTRSWAPQTRYTLRLNTVSIMKGLVLIIFIRFETFFIFLMSYVDCIRTTSKLSSINNLWSIPNTSNGIWYLLGICSCIYHGTKKQQRNTVGLRVKLPLTTTGLNHSKVARQFRSLPCPTKDITSELASLSAHYPFNAESQIEKL